jgi:hypothetical protein
MSDVKDRKGRRRVEGFTLVELLALIVAVECILLGIVLIQEWVHGWLGVFVGGGIGFAVFFLGTLLWALVQDLSVGGLPRLPECRQGGCRGPGMFKGYGDYECDHSGEEGYLICQHGGRYKRTGRRFVSIRDDGTEVPYLIWRPFRGWFPDDGSISPQLTRKAERDRFVPPNGG